MPRKFGEIAFTPEVKLAQEQRGARPTYERYIANGPANEIVTPKIEEFIAQLDGFYLGEVLINPLPVPKSPSPQVTQSQTIPQINLDKVLLKIALLGDANPIKFLNLLTYISFNS